MLKNHLLLSLLLLPCLGWAQVSPISSKIKTAERGLGVELEGSRALSSLVQVREYSGAIALNGQMRINFFETILGIGYREQSGYSGT